MSETIQKWMGEFTRDRASVDVVFDRAGEGETSKPQTLIFEGIGRKKWRELVAQHPPTEEQQRDAEREGNVAEFNPDSLVPDAIALTCVEPGVSLEQAEWIYSEFPETAINEIWAAVLKANVVGNVSKGEVL